MLGLNDTSVLVGYFVMSPIEREKRDRKDNRGDEREAARLGAAPHWSELGWVRPQAKTLMNGYICKMFIFILLLLICTRI